MNKESENPLEFKSIFKATVKFYLAKALIAVVGSILFAAIGLTILHFISKG